MREKIKDLVIHYQGNYPKIREAFIQQRWVRSYPCDQNYVTFLDEEYPECFNRLQYPPLVLFYEGDLSLFKQPLLSVVGSREINAYSRDCTNRLVRQIASVYTIVSGCAKGIDAIAHWAAMDKGKTIGILGCGLDVIYPKSNEGLINEIKKHHLLISEYPPECPPLKHHFPWRNRLIAASSPHLWVMSGKRKSGTMHTVNEALNLDSQIYALPHPYDSELGEGVNQCINDGAVLLTKEIVLDMMK